MAAVRAVFFGCEPVDVVRSLLDTFKNPLISLVE